MNEEEKNPAIKIENVNIRYGDNRVLNDVSIDVPKNSIYAFIGPSGCGKTTMIRSINRMNDFVAGFKLTGRVLLNGTDIYTDKKPQVLRKKIGMVFQQPNPLPVSIMQNMILPLTEHYRGAISHFRELAEQKLKACALYGEVKDKLDKPAFELSGGQQQRLCIARALMLEPSVILFDEPCSALDPISTHTIEDLLIELKKERTIIIVTHNMEQARRVSDYTAFFYNGVIAEAGQTNKLFFTPETELLEKYITGKFS
ncbi:MAG: phosphate ABC transporter ATP-binding protein [Defluviitaleaceae bacterium]|nr:phosphate ABC transporter ATP-binding protein [Defluviitaleaceae bacterium]